jgi:enoyl-CoA hydratase/carnithine racemase
MQSGQVRYVSEIFRTGDDLVPYATAWLETLARFAPAAIEASCAEMRTAVETRPHLAQALSAVATSPADPGRLPTAARAWLAHGKGSEHE